VSVLSDKGGVVKKQLIGTLSCFHVLLQVRPYLFLFIFISFLIFLPCLGFAAIQGGLGGGGAISNESQYCISPEQSAEIKHTVEMYKNNISGARLMDTNAGLYTFYPMGGTLFRDVYVNNYVDLDLSSGLLDWGCDDWTYNGHDAHDIDIRSFGEQAIGVPIFAVQDGTVIDAHDGEFDMNISAPNQPANYVLIDHGNGRICYYWHMKKNSVAVSAGEQVSAGQQIGLVGSSGRSTGPHLHFATYEDGNVVEPQAGYCRPGESLWVKQIPKRVDTYIWDYGISGVDLSSYNYSSELPRKNQIMGTDTFYPWIKLNNLPANSTYRVKIVKPNNISWGDWNNSFNNSSTYRLSWWYFTFSFSGITDYGTWRFVFYVNGTKILDAPFEVVSSYSPTFNRPPEPVSVSFEPAYPTDNDVVVCRVNTDIVFDDMDYDIVRYEYVWQINGTEVRRITSAACSDAFPHNIVVAGDLITCTVTPNDGKENGPIAQVSCIVHEQDCQYKLLGDLDGNCKVDMRDFSVMASKWLMDCYENPSDPGCIPW
jgi:hypothetical protein